MSKIQQRKLLLPRPPEMVRAQVAHLRARETEALAKDVEHPADLVRVNPLAAHPRPEIARVELSAAHVPHAAENALELFRKIQLQPFRENILHAVGQPQHRVT